MSSFSRFVFHNMCMLKSIGLMADYNVRSQLGIYVVEVVSICKLWTVLHKLPQSWCPEFLNLPQIYPNFVQYFLMYSLYVDLVLKDLYYVARTSTVHLNGAYAGIYSNTLRQKWRQVKRQTCGRQASRSWPESDEVFFIRWLQKISPLLFRLNV